MSKSFLSYPLIETDLILIVFILLNDNTFILCYFIHSLFLELARDGRAVEYNPIPFRILTVKNIVT